MQSASWDGCREDYETYRRSRTDNRSSDGTPIALTGVRLLQRGFCCQPRQWRRLEPSVFVRASNPVPGSWHNIPKSSDQVPRWSISTRSLLWKTELIATCIEFARCGINGSDGEDGKHSSRAVEARVVVSLLFLAFATAAIAPILECRGLWRRMNTSQACF